MSFLWVFHQNVPVETKDNTEATVSNIWFYFPINDLDNFMKKKYMANILPKGNTICFQGPMDVGLFLKNSSLFVEKVSFVVSGVSATEIISHGEVGRVLRTRPTMTTLFVLPKVWQSFPLSNKIYNDDKNKLEFEVVDNDKDIIHPSKVVISQQKDIFGSFCVTVDDTYGIYDEVLDEDDGPETAKAATKQAELEGEEIEKAAAIRQRGRRNLKQYEKD